MGQKWLSIVQGLTGSLVEWTLNGCSGPHTDVERRPGPALLVSIQNLLSLPTTIDPLRQCTCTFSGRGGAIMLILKGLPNM